MARGALRRRVGRKGHPRGGYHLIKAPFHAMHKGFKGGMRGRKRT
jgi:hypothetical protein